MKKYFLEGRVVQFSIDTILLTKKFEKSDAGTILSRQIIRSSSSASLNYGEAMASESRKDFIHKMKISLKELSETLICYTIISGCSICSDSNKMNTNTKECKELIAMFTASVKTAQSNMRKEAIAR